MPDERRLRVLAITKLFPNAVEPLSAPFNRQQFTALARRCDLDVMATIPWFPGASLAARWSSAGKLAAVPRREVIAGLPVTHPRTLFVPRVGHAAWGALYAASIAPALAKYRGVDVVLGSWAYPDGFAAVIAARLLGVPCAVKVHGSDINGLAQLPGPRRMLQWALPRAARVVVVSRALGDAVAALGVARDRITLVRNGVDGDLFFPRDRDAAHVARVALDLPPGPIALYVGNLKVDKGVLDLVTAWEQVSAAVPDATLAIVGAGPARAELDRSIAALGPRGDRIRVVGAVPLTEVPRWLAAADVLTLPSHAEGTPNVVLEALACGRRVVATAVGGIPDLITSDLLGALVPPRDPVALASALCRALCSSYVPATIAAAGASGSWDASAAALHDVLLGAASASSARTLWPVADHLPPSSATAGSRRSSPPPPA